MKHKVVWDLMAVIFSVWKYFMKFNIFSVNCDHNAKTTIEKLYE